ncbi:ABC transporter ATP-binding protein [Amphibacillus indicireducens]|uniref:ABC transporter ATP-binding protein n=1 Tax=Amphibacillus indicireducens TaxID=1076330 RepID=A0ABP7VJY6_9BACI
MFFYIKRFWKENSIVFLLMLITGVCQTVAGVLTAYALNALIEFDYQSFFIILLIILGVYFVFLLFMNFEINKQSQTMQMMSTTIRMDMTERMERASYSGFHEKQVGTYASWLSTDINTIETHGFDQFYAVVKGVIATFTAIIGLFVFHWSIVLWTLLISGLTLLLPKMYQKKLANVSLKTTEEGEHFLSRITDVLNGFDTLFSFNLLKKITTDTEKASLVLAKAKNKRASIIAKVAILGALGNIFGQLSILGLTGYLAFLSVVSVGAFSATGNLASTVFNTVGNLSQQIASFQSVGPIFDKFEKIKSRSQQVNQKIDQVDSGIILKNMSYAYGDKQVLEHINQVFDLGKKYAIVGASGSGKTTLLNILNGKLTDYTGSIIFNGYELNALSGYDLREAILYLDQQPYLFDGTIRDNITLGESFTDEEIMLALEQSSLQEVVAQLPNGIDTSIGESGRLLSGGQKQRVTLARGLIRGKQIILLDEGTSSLDQKSALEIEESLMSQKDLTVIMITHHLREEIKEKLDDVLRLSSQ